ncbi:MAG: hypothetical protein JO025_08340 [Verrucomicrobia bacterium]|nr:hypothetical protein [Verrucomicrobiota bacterium]
MSNPKDKPSKPEADSKSVGSGGSTMKDIIRDREKQDHKVMEVRQPKEDEQPDL